MNNSTLIIGSGKHAFTAAESLIRQNVDVFLCARNKVPDTLISGKTGHLHVFENSRILSSKGCIGDFRVIVESSGNQRSLNISSILIAEEYARKSMTEPYGLKKAPSVTSLSGMQEMPAKTDTQKSAVFLTGISYESHPVILEEVMHGALNFQKQPNVQAYIFTGNLKVAQNGLEALYRESRKKGVVFVKCKDALPKIQQEKNGAVSIEFLDEITCENFSLCPDVIIVDETIIPGESLAHLAAVFGLDQDESGFLQTENVHRTPLLTNVRGILVAGPSRRIQPENDHARDMEIATREIKMLLEAEPEDIRPKAEISRGLCIRCLTCRRLCPYQAVSLDTYPSVMPDACEGCGICAAHCPRHAISIEHLSVSDITGKTVKQSRNAKTFVPHIVAFCCARSAAVAHDQAVSMGYKIPKGTKMIQVPCGGAVSLEHLLSAFQSGADGVWVITCHEGNCHGENGNQLARANAETVMNLLAETGVEKERISFMTLAANMGKAFAEEAAAFHKRIKEMRPLKISE